MLQQVAPSHVSAHEGRKIWSTLDLLLLPNPVARPIVDLHAEKLYNRKHGVQLLKSIKVGETVLEVNNLKSQCKWTPGIVIEHVGNTMYVIPITSTYRRSLVLTAIRDQDHLIKISS